MRISGVIGSLTLLATMGEALLLSNSKHSTRQQLQLQIDGNDNSDKTLETSRRGFICSSLGLGSLVLLSSGQPAFAAAKQEEIDKANLVKGYQRLQFLLDNWEKETTVCGMGGDKLEVSCDRTPFKVMEYMGYKSTTDPLYKAEKTLRRLYEDAPASRDLEFVEAIETYAENADEASGMAFVSSWGEANPGKCSFYTGGVDKLIECDKSHIGSFLFCQGVERIV